VLVVDCSRVKIIAVRPRLRDAENMNERSTDRVTIDPITSLETESMPTGKVLPFPERSCGQCVFAPEAGASVDDHPLLSRLRPHTPYAGFSFLPKALQRWRGRKGLKISAAAQGLGVASSTWGHWETGFRFPTGSVLLDLVQYTGLSLVELVCEHGEHCPLHHQLKEQPTGTRQGA
jgi:DNA-binding transcriptional regulator YiaG